MPYRSNRDKPNGKGPHNRLPETASTFLNESKQAANALGQTAEDVTHAVGGRIKTWAHSVRTQVPQEGFVGSAASSLADSLETGGDYLQRKTLKGMADDVTDLIRNNPLPAMLVGLALGFALAQATRRS